MAQTSLGIVGWEAASTPHAFYKTPPAESVRAKGNTICFGNKKAIFLKAKTAFRKMTKAQNERRV